FEFIRLLRAVPVGGQTSPWAFGSRGSVGAAWRPRSRGVTIPGAGQEKELAVAAVEPVAAFEGLRPRLRGLAYRMLGSVGDTEDVVQDAYLRWHQTDGAADAIRSPE